MISQELSLKGIDRKGGPAEWSSPPSQLSFASSLVGLSTMGMGLHLHQNRIPSGVGRKEVLEGKGYGDPVFVSPSTTVVVVVVVGNKCRFPAEASATRKFLRGFLDRPRPSGRGNHCSFSMGRLQNRAPPELAFQQPIQGSSVAQRPEPVTRSLA